MIISPFVFLNPGSPSAMTSMVFFPMNSRASNPPVITVFPWEECSRFNQHARYNCQKMAGKSTSVSYGALDDTGQRGEHSHGPRQGRGPVRVIAPLFTPGAAGLLLLLRDLSRHVHRAGDSQRRLRFLDRMGYAMTCRAEGTLMFSDRRPENTDKISSFELTVKKTKLGK